jgi:hypothetical protein
VGDNQQQKSDDSRMRRIEGESEAPGRDSIPWSVCKEMSVKISGPVKFATRQAWATLKGAIALWSALYRLFFTDVTEQSPFFFESASALLLKCKSTFRFVVCATKYQFMYSHC